MFQLLLLAVAYFVSRLIFLTTLPIFNDEAIEIHLSQAVTQAPAFLFRLAGDGRGPLVLVFGAISQFLPFDPLVNARLMHLLFSTVTFIATIVLAKKLGFDIWVQNILALFLITSPYLLFFDRLSLPNSFVTTLAMLSLLVQAPLVGFVLGIGYWYFSLILLVIPGAMLMTYKNLKTFAISAVIFLLFVALLFVHPDYRLVLSQSPIRIFQTSWLVNMKLLFQWFFWYLTPWMVILFFIGACRVNPKLLVYIFLPLVAIIVFGVSMSGRNLMILVPMILLVAAGGMPRNRLIVAIVIALNIISSLVIAVNPYSYGSMPDLRQYMTGWPSGYGVKEASDWLINQSKKETFVVYVKNDSGNPQDGVFSYLAPHHIPVSYLPVRYQPAYFVSRGPELAGVEKNLTEVARFTKPYDSSYVGIYKITIQ